MDVDIRIDARAWRADPRIRAHVRAAVAAAAAVAGRDGGAVSILLTDDAAMRALNRDWRGKDAATNVLSFPQQAGPLHGDIALGFETVAREAQEKAIPLQHHLAHLVIHGILHLFGHDHDDEAGADAMESLEIRALASLAIPDPYEPAKEGAGSEQ